MCGRLLVHEDGVAYFEVEGKTEVERIRAPDRFQRSDVQTWTKPPLRSLAPTEPIAVYRLGADFVPDEAFWTLVPPWAGETSSVVTTRDGRRRLQPPPHTHFNSRKSTLLGSRGWSQLLRNNRCVVFAHGFFEWSDEDLLPAGEPKKMGLYRLSRGRVMPLAGIWCRTRTDSDPILTFSVITCEPNNLLRSLPHHRMPAVLPEAQVNTWLDPTTTHPEDLLTPAKDEEFEAEITLVGPLPRREGSALELEI